MDKITFDAENKALIKKIEDMLQSKGGEYQADSNVLSNFETNAAKLGLTPFQIWAVYFNKHVESINNAIKKNPSNPNDPSMPESLESRIIDAVAYLMLLNGMNKKNSNKVYK